MAILLRPFLAESDKTLMYTLACQFPEENLHVLDLPYRLSSWAFDNPDNIGLWFNGNELVAWAVLQNPFWTIDCVCHPTYGLNLHPEMLAWADRRACATINTPSGHPTWYVDVFTGQIERIHDLEKAGFICQADVGEDPWSKVLMRRSIQTPVRVYSPPKGFTVRSLAGEKEVEGYVELHRSVFESKNMTVDWRKRTLEHPAYKAALDIVVESPDGRLVAFCICWQDENSLDGRVEPLGCLKDFRRYALGRVALSAGLQRLQSLGARNIFVETDSFRNTAFQLYESFDFQGIQNVLVYRKDYKAE